MTCPRYASTHDGRNPQRYYRPAPKARTVVMCSGCAEGLNALSEMWRIDRREGVRV